MQEPHVTLHEEATPLPIEPPLRRERRRRRRRSFSLEQKRQFVRETYRPGATVAAVAREFSLQPNQLSQWRQKIPMDGNGSAVGKIEPNTNVAWLQSLVDAKLAEVEVLRTAITLAERATTK